MWREDFSVKTQHSSASDRNVYGCCCDSLIGTTGVTFHALGLRMKNLVRLGLDDDDGAPLPLGITVLSSVSKFGSCLEDPLALAWGVLAGLLSYTCDLVITTLHSCYPLAGSSLRDPEREADDLL